MKQAVIFVISLLTAMSSAIVVSTSESPAPTFEPSPSTSTPDPDPLFQSHSDTYAANLFLHYNTLLEQYNLKTAECEVLKQDCEKLGNIAQAQTLTHTLTLDKCTRDRDSSKKMRLKAISNCMKENLKKAEDVYIKSLVKKIHICDEASQLKSKVSEVKIQNQILLSNNRQ
ncbi:hypothetical protein BATDEDRAFT_23272 [Batrachochytrium dendrobatidis JAM81]|uniref:Uncharacterized protein n=1 Tax=Batrachochytrium dendrobatidis (strain JAM81 / FGSC 10211) TaxID=684364 RepID=F4NYI2_BATDJ|nr:uncharacterized protein BATDEDRAFT_23272 [Batrachochytrium dendrobatidis JAM81]EGF82027.1 hypothetical protein BATDEDRAFT_23272 [Batrachochytrium dendrobatidis JAM81]|eukprot:XP_006677239.1 hypothetical protein BATDEDRAFT_23272 [Batrachochytrium dendrobatidis JAM81]